MSTHHSHALMGDPAIPSMRRVFIAIVICSAVLSVLFFLSWLYFWSAVTSQLNEKESGNQSFSIDRVRSYENSLLHSLRWKDKSKGQVQIPIEDAMSLVVQSYSGTAHHVK